MDVVDETEYVWLADEVGVTGCEVACAETVAVKEGLPDDVAQAVVDGVKVLRADSEGVALRHLLGVDVTEYVWLAEDVGVAG